jgi:two-component system sensor histidine kinase/response regulator
MLSERHGAGPPPVFVSTVPAPRGERRLALAIVLASLAGFIVAVPFVRVPLARSPAFIPGYEAALEINDLITAVLLFGQFTRLRSRAVLALACGYLFDALMIIPHAMTFPGVFSPTGLLGAGEQTTAWLYTFWHGGFPLFVIAYAILRRWEGNFGPLRARIGPTAAASIAGIVALAGICTLLTTAGHDFLPIVMRGGDYSLIITKGISPTTWTLSLVALIAVWRLRPPTVLDLWLMVVMSAWLFDVALSGLIGSARYDLGFYAGRIYGLLAASFVLMILLLESQRLYGRLADALEIAEAYNAELERSREDLARAQRMEAIGQLTGGIAHDFNNLLTVVIGNLDAAIEHVGRAQAGPEQVSPEQVSPEQVANEQLGNEQLGNEQVGGDRALAGILAAAMRGAQRGARITSQLLATGRRQLLAPEALDVRATVGAMSEMLRSALTSGIALNIAVPPDLPEAIADAAQLEVAVLNLIVNSRDAIGNGGTITVTAGKVELSATAAGRLEVDDGRYVVVRVTDTGSGMTQDVAARAFEPFFTTKGLASNSGLGLSQVYGFARQSGGTCTIESAPGRGTTVSIYLPVAREAATAASIGADDAAAPERFADDRFGARIMVVEDDADVRRYLVDFLSRVGFDVVEANNGDDALAKLGQAGRIDVLCTDIVMPGGLTGYDVARLALAIRPELKVIFMSGYSDQAGTAANGNSPFLAKPFRGNELVDMVRSVIGR